MKKCQFLADAATHVHSNSPPAMPCSNRHPPDSANLRFNGITRPIYKRSKSCPLLLSFSAHSFALFALFAATKAPFDHHNIEFSPSRILPSVHPSGWKPDSWFTLKPSPPPCHLMFIDCFLRATSTLYSPEIFFYPRINS